MKNKLKTTLIILAIIVSCLSVGVYAATVISATDVTYTKPDGTTTSVKEALDELHSIQPLAKAVSVGDYVAYDATNNYSYESPTGTGKSHGNGYGSQTFTSSSNIKWRVLGWDEITGGVMLISEEPIQTNTGTGFYMKGVIGYFYAEKELNEICKIYGYGIGANINKKFNYATGNINGGSQVDKITGSGARSINVDDINKICNVMPSRALNGSYGSTFYINAYYVPDNNSDTRLLLYYNKIIF